jgi:hypothetical protein
MRAQTLAACCSSLSSMIALVYDQGEHFERSDDFLDQFVSGDQVVY